MNNTIALNQETMIDHYTAKNTVSFGLVRTPFRSMGWNDAEAVEYVLEKFTFGGTDDLRERLKKIGVDMWLTEQLTAKTDVDFEKRALRKFTTTGLSLKQLARTYPGLIVTLKSVAQHRRANGKKTLRGQISFNDMFGTILRNVQKVDRRWFYQMPNASMLEAPMKSMGLGNFMELMYELAGQKLFRAVHAPNQLEERLVDFWFNHFNVSITRINDVATNVLSYERDAIRPFVLKRFNKMLAATARHPAMLTYLDNTLSNAKEGAAVLSNAPLMPFRHKKQQPGINENYARELLELHTLGVDGGYQQRDVIEIARILTGWKTSPLLYPISKKLEGIVLENERKSKKSFIDNGFYFDAARHDAEAKTVLGRHYNEKKGYEEGQQLIQQLATHSSTADHISKKLAMYFVSDTPSFVLIAKMADIFGKTEGHIGATIRTMVEAPEFWNPIYRKAKAKSPFDFVVSMFRENGAIIEDASAPLKWLSSNGQPLYAFQPPTGYPTIQEFWINEAAIAQRIKFAYALSAGNMEGISPTRPLAPIQRYTSPQFQKR